MTTAPATCGWEATEPSPAAKQGAILIECGTVTVDWVLELDTAAKARGCKLLDAPGDGKPRCG